MKIWWLSSGIEEHYNGNMEDLMIKYNQGNFERLETLKDSLEKTHYICRLRIQNISYIMDITKD